MLSRIVIVPANWNIRRRVVKSFYSDILSWFWANQPLLFLLMLNARNGDEPNTCFIVFGLTWLGIKPTIYSILEVETPTITPSIWFTGLEVYGVYRRHFQQYFNYIMAVSFIGGGNRSIWRKQPTFRKSLTNFITKCCIEHTRLSGIRTHYFSGDSHWLQR